MVAAAARDIVAPPVVRARDAVAVTPRAGAAALRDADAGRPDMALRDVVGWGVALRVVVVAPTDGRGATLITVPLRGEMAALDDIVSALARPASDTVAVRAPTVRGDVVPAAFFVVVVFRRDIAACER